jgi:uncharacterized protein YndB with AHSA1/START domain
MERKTKINAEDGRQDLVITREFDLPLDLLFRAYVEPEIVEQWMGTKVVKLESRPHGGWQFETSDPQGNVVLRTNGVIHEFVPEQKITRTFERLTDETSKLTMQIVYKSPADREAMLKLPFAAGINMAHNRLEQVVKQLI